MSLHDTAGVNGDSASLYSVSTTDLLVRILPLPRSTFILRLFMERRWSLGCTSSSLQSSVTLETDFILQAYLSLRHPAAPQKSFAEVLSSLTQGGFWKTQRLKSHSKKYFVLGKGKSLQSQVPMLCFQKWLLSNYVYTWIKPLSQKKKTSVLPSLPPVILIVLCVLNSTSPRELLIYNSNSLPLTNKRTVIKF